MIEFEMEVEASAPANIIEIRQVVDTGETNPETQKVWLREYAPEALLREQAIAAGVTHVMRESEIVAIDCADLEMIRYGQFLELFAQRDGGAA